MENASGELPWRSKAGRTRYPHRLPGLRIAESQHEGRPQGIFTLEAVAPRGVVPPSPLLASVSMAARNERGRGCGLGA